MARNREWASWEEKYLWEHTNLMTDTAIAKELGRTVNAVKLRRGKLGLTNQQPPWTAEDKAFVRENLDYMTDAQIATELGRRPDSIGALRRRMSGQKHPPWTEEETAYLTDHWGSISISGIAKKLGRSLQAVKRKATKLRLGKMLESGDYMTFNQLILAVTGGSNSYSYQMESWVKKRGFPVHNKRVVNDTVRIVYLNEFWAWAEKHRSFIDFSRMEPLILGAEPDWVPLQRKIDMVSFANQRKDPWTSYEDQRLIYLLKQHKYTYAEMSRELKRSAGAIQRRCTDLGLKERPVRESPYNPWSDEDLQRMANMIRQGYSYTMIGDACGGRSEKAVRSVVYQKYQTENADKVRDMLGDGLWGAGAPEPTVKHCKHKESVKKEVAKLCGLLLVMRNSMEWGEYWQKDMCQHWDNTRGCLMKCSDCDSCDKFQRIRPQYCRACGREFLERHEKIYCPKCRSMRKKQAQRKYAVLHAKERR